MRDVRRANGHPGLGARLDAQGTTFRVWAPTTTSVELVLDRAGSADRPRPLRPGPSGMFEISCPDVVAGDRYRYLLDGRGPFPDPASRFQPDGVHGASMVVDPAAFTWSDAGWGGVPLEDLVVYELHVGTFTEGGRFSDVEARLPSLRDLGVTAVELMPVADFPGSRNWGYDGVALFAPARCYGTPGDLRRLVNSAHRLGLAVLLDVVYNHVGPDGAYLYVFSPYYFTDRHESPWGAGVNLDGEHSSHVRDFFYQNALHWLEEYHIDGLRLDATHAIQDESPQPFLAELRERVDRLPGSRRLLIAEDDRNLAHMVKPVGEAGWGLDAVWADDLHHQLRRLAAGDSDGYYQDFSGTTADIAATIRQGWFFTGQQSSYRGEPRGTDSTGIPLERFVVCLQNHDQVGNRALGDRLHHRIDLAAFRALTTMLLTVPETPLLFMGQEWAASTPFLYFTDHHAELGRLVTEGRRREFQRFAAFSEPSSRERIPDPQDGATFDASRLRWDETTTEPHAGMRRLHSALLSLRRVAFGGRGALGRTVEVVAPDEGSVVMRVSAASLLVVVSRLAGAGHVDLSTIPCLADLGGWRQLLSSEDPEFTKDSRPPRVSSSGPHPAIEFLRPSALVFEARWTG